VVLPVGCGTDRYKPHSQGDVKVQAIREEFGISKDQLMILTAGGDGASKGAQEVMQALSMIDARRLNGGMSAKCGLNSALKSRT